MIIVPKMRPRSLASLALALMFTAAALPASDHTLPPAKDASSYPAFDAHAEEHVVIAAEPFDTKEKMGIFRVDYLKNGFMPIRIIVTNNSDKPISLVDARIHFITAAGDRIPAAEPEDVERRMTHVSNTGRKIPMPAPLPPMGGKPKTPDSKIEQDFSEFEYRRLQLSRTPRVQGSSFTIWRDWAVIPCAVRSCGSESCAMRVGKRCSPSIFRSISIWTQGTTFLSPHPPSPSLDCRSDTLLLRLPDILVNLQAQAGVQAVGQHPFHEFTRIEQAVGGVALWRRRL